MISSSSSYNYTNFTLNSHLKPAELSTKNSLKINQSHATNATKRSCQLFDLHKELIPYNQSWQWQKSLIKSKNSQIGNQIDDSDSILVLQHPSVYTLGTGSSDKNFNFELENSPFEIYRTERGGEVTYHGPGQIVMYPIMNLRYHKMDLHWYLRSLEEVIIRALKSTFSLNAERIQGFTGVWIRNEKISAIGIRVSKWVTYHGLALNICTDLNPFKQIIPCGIKEKGVTSLKKLILGNRSSEFDEINKLGDEILIDVVYESLIREFEEVFQVDLKCSSYDLNFS